MFFTILLSGILIFSPVTAETGDTQKWMGSPVWIQEKAHVSTFQPKLFRGAELAINLTQYTTNYVNSGKDYLAAGSFNDAKTAFDSALERDGASFDAWLGRAYTLEALKRYQSASESYDSAITFAQDHKNAYYAYAGKGRSSLENQKFQDSMDAFTQAIIQYHRVGAEDRNDLINIYEGLAAATEKLGLQTEADDAKEKAAELRSQKNS